MTSFITFVAFKLELLPIDYEVDREMASLMYIQVARKQPKGTASLFKPPLNPLISTCKIPTWQIDDLQLCNSLRIVYASSKPIRVLMIDNDVAISWYTGQHPHVFFSFIIMDFQLSFESN